MGFGVPVLAVLMLWLLMHALVQSDTMAILSSEQIGELDEMIVTGFVSRLNYVLSAVLGTTTLWFATVGVLALMLGLGLRLSLRLQVAWAQLARLLGYVLTPGLICMGGWWFVSYTMGQPVFGYLPEGSSFLISTAADLGSTIFFGAMFLWPYFLLLAGLEEEFRISRFQAQVAVLASITVGFSVILAVSFLTGGVG